MRRQSAAQRARRLGDTRSGFASAVHGKERLRNGCDLHGGAKALRWYARLWQGTDWHREGKECTALQSTGKATFGEAWRWHSDESQGVGKA